MPETTPSQTVGPYLSIGLPWPDGPDVVPAGEPAAIRIHGRVLDGAGEPVPDAMIETWQADADGRFDHPDDPRGAVASGFRGFGRCPTDPNGDYEIRTIMPGSLPGPAGGTQAPHIDVSVFARGLLHRVVTRIYFEDNDNSGDPVLASVPEARQGTLIATKAGDGYRFDIRLQGEGETVFFDV
ncbi:protocatechuate 3,4-dioxygenase subunit alpha [Amycolatopsis keratiniphila]|uniref:protocatechuate 3,4-dioxygenase subunit alpha n=1 Tax=Amycolatopsis keratiniphila TaxID=129921 RepID=UPI00087B687E|nr:protocatechuate 3,4-dioxygenase subunit alpha [Amycolatopsis keratiniphila]OLZ58894.1 protocatechuate 3,4-dioxygenase subunit alpha [Amycolatopsis keratiniphila subsp. nogabecina]SDU70351.1 protocatechuate 3,4-dioxygenase, alpha subunit [Amycolatopsis keratiniphila]